MSVLKLELDNWVVSRLAEPFPVEEVKWLPAFGYANNGPTKVLAYVDARMVVNRLNEVVGANNWSDSYHESAVGGTEIRDMTDYASLPEEKIKKAYGKIKGTVHEFDKKLEYNEISYGGIRCTLNVLGISKSDVGVPSFAEQLKGAYSDSLKRAAVKFGIGEYFYRLGTLEAQYEGGRVVRTPELPDWAMPYDRPSPDAVIQETILNVLNQDLPESDRSRVQSILDEIYVMGSYNTSAPILLKRAVYEALLPYMRDSEGTQ